MVGEMDDCGFSRFSHWGLCRDMQEECVTGEQQLGAQTAEDTQLKVQCEGLCDIEGQSCTLQINNFNLW